MFMRHLGGRFGLQGTGVKLDLVASIADRAHEAGEAGLDGDMLMVKNIVAT